MSGAIPVGTRALRLDIETESIALANASVAYIDLVSFQASVPELSSFAFFGIVAFGLLGYLAAVKTSPRMTHFGKVSNAEYTIPRCFGASRDLRRASFSGKFARASSNHRGC